jgi:signal-transduction protein with cAMP-binding, CBS, and nucleotidyltransferase domain
LIVPVLKKIQFFKTQFSDLRREDFKFIAEKLKFKFHNSGENVMNFGDRGHVFYIIIQGKVNVLVPDSSDSRNPNYKNDKFIEGL